MTSGNSFVGQGFNVAEDAVCCELLFVLNSLITRENTGNSWISGSLQAGLASKRLGVCGKF
jgi:hypothetical protein